jgi:hypothetical protein
VSWLHLCWYKIHGLATDLRRDASDLDQGRRGNILGSHATSSSAYHAILDFRSQGFQGYLSISSSSCVAALLEIDGGYSQGPSIDFGGYRASQHQGPLVYSVEAFLG